MIATALVRACLWVASVAMRLALWLVEGGAAPDDLPPEVRRYLEGL